MDVINSWFSYNIYKIGVKPMETIEFQRLNQSISEELS